MIENDFQKLVLMDFCQRFTLDQALDHDDSYVLRNASFEVRFNPKDENEKGYMICLEFDNFYLNGEDELNFIAVFREAFIEKFGIKYLFVEAKSEKR